MKLYDYLDSGNGYKVRLVLALLDLPYIWEERDILAGATRTPEFRAKNPNGRIPLLELDDGTHLAESNAIIWYLAEGSPLVPADRLQRAQVLQWMFFEQYSHEPYLAVQRFIAKHLPPDSPRQAEMPDRIARSHAALAVMEEHLQGRDWFVGDRMTLADIALYAYTHVAEEGPMSIAAYTKVRSWLARVAAQPGHVALAAQPG